MAAPRISACVGVRVRANVHVHACVSACAHVRVRAVNPPSQSVARVDVPV